MKDLAKEFKGLWVYILLVALGLSYLAYSQHRGIKWIGATRTDPPADRQQPGYRYYYHK